MTVRITKLEESNTRRIVIRIEGKLAGDDAALLEETINGLENVAEIEADLFGVTFIDRKGSLLISRMKRQGVIFSGIDFFVRSVIEAHENEIDE